MSVLHQNKWRQEKEKYVLEFHLRKKKARHFEGKPSCFCCSSVIVSKLFFLLIFFSCIGENNYKNVNRIESWKPDSPGRGLLPSYLVFRLSHLAG